MKWDDVLTDIGDLQVFTGAARTVIKLSVDAEKEIDKNRLVHKALRKPDPYAEPDDLLEAQKEAASRQAFARREVRQGFRYLYSLAVIKLWSVLESAVGDFILDCIKEPSEHIKKDVLRSLTGPLMEFLAASNEDRAAFLVQQLRTATKASLKPGVGRFEVMLDAIGMGGPVDDNVRRTLLELSETRNVIVHRRGIADRQFTERCPWVGASVGEPLVLIESHWALFQKAVLWYFMELDRRECFMSGVEWVAHARDYLAQLTAEIEEMCSSRPNKINTPSN